MKLLVMDDHEGEGILPKKAMVFDIESTKNSLHWYACTINGWKTYVPDTLLSKDKLVQDYNPTELVLKKGEMVTPLVVVFEWMYVKNSQQRKGWVPSHKLMSWSKVNISHISTRSLDNCK